MSAADDHDGDDTRTGGNGTAPLGDVLPFRPRAEGAPHSAGTAGRSVRSAPATPPDADVLADEVTALAAKGLGEAEIRIRLGLPAALDAALERTLAVAFERGQLLGRAQIKEAQFEAALQGRVTAQIQVLARLGEPQEGDGGETEQDTLGRGQLPGEDAEAGKP